MVEIHRELWGNRNFLGKIFRTAKVGKADFTELQSLLDALNPGRHSDEYVSKDVFATKVAFLHSKSTPIDLPPNLVDGLVPRPVLVASQPPSSDVVGEGGVVGDDGVVDDDDDDAVGNDDDVMGNVDVVMDDNAAIVVENTHLPNEATALFPYTIQYVDLTVLRWQGMLRVPRLMLFRNEWGDMIDIFNNGEKGMEGSAVFSGQPGIGEHYYWYLTITSNQRTRKNMHVVFHPHSLYHSRPANRVSGRSRQGLHYQRYRAPSGHIGGTSWCRRCSYTR